MMARKVCTAGVVGSYSYLIMDVGSEIIATIHEDEEELKKARHLEMEFAETWTNKQLQTLVGIRYETD